MIKIACPKCGQKVAAPDKMAGKKGQCPRCGAKVLLPAGAFGRTQTLSPEAVAAAAEATPAPIPKDFAGYEILGELGRGGMGVVYKAFDPKLKRTVALKVLLSAEHASKEEIERFFREASSAAKLQHPNIVPIHELKVHEGKHYYTMDFIEGEPLDKLIKDKKLNVRQSLELLEKVAKALDYAHKQGIVHRDLKPANIIVGPDGEPKVTDFGLAKVFAGQGHEEIKSLTKSGYAIGTPPYMAPEQAVGESKKADPRTDVYSMGCILYELLVGAPPFESDNVMDILRMHVEEEPVPPRKKGALVPTDVEAICLKCLAKHPEERYQTAGELAEDIRRFLENEPVAAARGRALRKVVSTLSPRRYIAWQAGLYREMLQPKSKLVVASYACVFVQMLLFTLGLCAGLNSRLGNMAMIVCLLVSPLTLILGLIARHSTTKKGEPGRRLATLAAYLGGCGTACLSLVLIIALVTVVWVVTSQNRDRAMPLPPPLSAPPPWLSVANRQLREARELFDGGKTDEAMERATRLTVEFPEAPEAAEAKRLILEIQARQQSEKKEPSKGPP